MFMKDVPYNIFNLHVHHSLLQNHCSARGEMVQLFTYALLTLGRIEAKSFSVPQKVSIATSPAGYLHPQQTS